MLIDSHSHLNFPDAFPDLTETCQQMNEGGVEAAVVVGIDIDSSQRAQDIASARLFPTAGIHPQTVNFEDNNLQAWKRLEALIDHSRCVAVGETGLDSHHVRVPPEIQEARFIRHLEIAKDRNKPVIVHCRDAGERMMEILKVHGAGTRGVLHCFDGHVDLGLMAMDMGWYVSTAGNITFKNADKLRNAVLAMKEDRFLVETDCPYLAPHPFRGQPCHPALMVHTANRLGELRGWSQEETIRITRQNTIDLFQLESVLRGA